MAGADDCVLRACAMGGQVAIRIYTESGTATMRKVVARGVVDPGGPVQNLTLFFFSLIFNSFKLQASF